MEVTIRIPSPGTCARLLRTWGLRALPAVLALVAVTMVLPGAREALAANNSITLPDTSGDMVGEYTSLELDASGYPVVSYYDSTNGDLKVLHCDDPDCTGGGESITSPDTADDVGLYTSLELDASGYPVVSYYDVTNGDLNVIHCNDANCDGAVNGAETITVLDAVGLVGLYTSLELDASGYPVVSYYDATNGDLQVIHCDDANCASFSKTQPDIGGDVGLYTSLELDASGYPVVSYYDDTNGDLKVLHCDDPDCTGGGESITSPDTTDFVGWYTSLELDSSGYPVVSYYDVTNLDLKVLHCDDPDCTGGGESITSPDTGGDVGYYTSLELNAKGFPVVSYYDDTNGDLKVMHCTDPDCTGGNESIVVPDTDFGVQGDHTSLQLDADGNPVVSYFDIPSDLKLLHCFLPTCGSLPGTLTITNTGQYALPKSCSAVFDASQTFLFTICDNDFQGAATHAACFDGTDSVCDDEDPTPGIRVTLIDGTYLVVPSKTADLHTTLTGPQACGLTSTTKCVMEFIHQPTVRPWYPYDLISPFGGIDGSVTADDITEVAGRFLEFKALP